ncbi:MAG: hypothetical protein SFX18_09440 [Pirellulales bacterium]|nr:hypothetical protein [Pirellulales bacterium]
MGKIILEKSLLGIFLALLLGLSKSVLAEDKPDPREELATAVPEAIRLLKKMEYEEFLTTFISPKQLEHVKNQKNFTIKQFAEQFEKTHATFLLEILQKIEGIKPELDKDGKMAWFVHGVKDAPSDTIVFEKVDKYWYMLNTSPPRPAEQPNAADSR